MLKIHKKQAGMSVTGWIFVIAVALFFGLLALQLVPSYLEFYSISNVMQSLKEDPQTNKGSIKDLKQAFYRRLDVNGVYDFDKNAVRITRDGGKKLVEVKYEVRKPMAGNIDVIMTFEKKVEWLAE